jgi:hypothetical protein
VVKECLQFIDEWCGLARKGVHGSVQGVHGSVQGVHGSVQDEERGAPS